MKFAHTWTLLLIAGCSSGLARAQLEIVTNAEPQRVFFGEAKRIAVTFRNPGDQEFKSEMRVRIFQATSATAVPVSERPWKELRVLPRQTILESASLDFPLVKAETIFLVRWLNGAHRITGTVEVLVYPTNLLHEVKLMVGESWNNLGVLDPKNQIKPALKNAMIGFVDLAETELDAFSGTLAIVGSCSPEDPEWNGLADRISKLARHGTPVVWIQGPSRRRDKIQPSFYAVPQNRAAVIVIQPELILDLPENPQSQVNLIYFFRLALNPQPLMRPDLPPHP